MCGIGENSGKLRAVGNAQASDTLNMCSIQDPLGWSQSYENGSHKCFEPSRDPHHPQICDPKVENQEKSGKLVILMQMLRALDSGHHKLTPFPITLVTKPCVCAIKSVTMLFIINPAPP